MTIPAANLHRVPNHVGRHAGALAEPLACVARCLFDPTVVEAGDRVLVVGPGTMGLLTAQAARAAGGIVTVAGLEQDRERLDVARGLGLAAITVGDEPASATGFEVVCECSGSETGAAYGLVAARKGGRFVQVGIFGRPVTADLDTVLFKELRYSSGNASTPGSWRRAIALLDQGLVALDPLVSHVRPLGDWRPAFDATRRGEGVKHVLDPRTE
jgi:L-iditol 2-dehydrogenase